ncbi:MAG: Phosphoribosyl 1,2-cyclic phosphodiesterase [Ferruginibacter sp.]|nr:Phosphoribosyl 1,2-cyclic phosphodiesterase [Ferruginibacter sp.]
MSLYISSLNSGSNGNCYYIGNDSEAVLVDAGISCKETERRMEILGLSMKKVKAIFITHEHADHIKGLTVLSERYQLPVFATARTHSGCVVKKPQVNHVHSRETISIGELSVSAFPKYHDAGDPCSFTISSKGINVGVFTDIGRPCDQLIANFSRCHAAFLEANYDETMLENGRYPYFLKNRIRNGHGHLSNKQALEVFIAHRPKYMSHLLLAHLSKDNNCPLLVEKMFSEVAGGTKVTIASRDEQSPVFRIHASLGSQRRAAFMMRPEQLSLFS